MKTTTSNRIAGLRQDALDAYLSYRIDREQLEQTGSELERAGQDEDAQIAVWEKLESRVLEPCSKGSRVVTDVDHFQLTSRYHELCESQPWTSREKALFRRQSFPAYRPPAPERATKGSDEFTKATLQNFSLWDPDRDGTLTDAELDKAMKRVWSPTATAALLTVRGYSSELRFCETDDGDDEMTGVTREDLQSFRRDGVVEEGATTAGINRLFAKAKERAAVPPSETALEQESFDPKSVVQRYAGSCMLLAHLISKPAEDVRAMFQEKNDGTVEIRFANGAKEIVDKLSQTERRYHATTRSDEQWPALLETAVAQHLDKHRPDPEGSVRNCASSIYQDEAVSLLYDREVETINLDDLSAKNTRTLLAEWSRSGEPTLVCGARTASDALDFATSPDILENGIINSHAYAVVSYDAKDDRVTLRNPWGRGEWAHSADGQDDGQFSMPFINFYASFKELYIPVPSPDSPM